MDFHEIKPPLSGTPMTQETSVSPLNPNMFLGFPYMISNVLVVQLVWPDQFRSVALDTTLSLIIWTFFRLCPSGFRLPLIGTFIMMTWTNSNQHILKPSFLGTFMNVPLSHLFTRGSILSGVQSKFFFASCCWIWVVAGFNAGGNVWVKKGDGPQKQQFSPHLLPTGHFPWLS